ncbi:MAG: aspartate carbamoyltransferase [Candidatus Diapherotrites archaeon]|nr:aspartate carbamoyltransferase [Candidatus Diapherotrites archaeon]MDZ4256183.1 aspartate carbamoyltransferase [archaeon]
MKVNHVLSTSQFSDTRLLERLFALADEMESRNTDQKLFQSLQGKILATVFYEPSTRTRFSFEAAMHRLGGRVISTESASQFSSMTKGETLEDTIKIIAGYSDAIVLRHPEEGSAARAAKVSRVPIINAGDGSGEHPTQALLDLYTIRKELGDVRGKRIALMGDLRYGRTVHSLINLLILYEGVEIILVSPPELRLPEVYQQLLSTHGIPFTEHPHLSPITHDLDVVYMTRVQRERFVDDAQYQKVRNSCVLDARNLVYLSPHTIIMHPLPRVNEIHPSIDADPRATYFRQAQNGLFIRMALLELLFEQKFLEQETLSQHNPAVMPAQKRT